jgi:hypothetical protein
VTAEPPRTTVHQVQHLLLDGCRILQARAASYLDPDTLGALDRMVSELSPMEGFPIEPVEARYFGLAHSLRTLVDDISPHVAGGPVNPSEFPQTLRRVEDALKTALNQKLSSAR